MLEKRRQTCSLEYREFGGQRWERRSERAARGSGTGVPGGGQFVLKKLEKVSVI